MNQSTPEPKAAATARTQRYVLSHRRSGRLELSARMALRQSLDNSFEKLFARSVDLVADHQPQQDDGRRVVVFQASEAEILAKRHQLGAGVLLEPELPRRVARSWPSALEQLSALQGAALAGAGTGTMFEVELRCGGEPLPGVRVTLYLTTSDVRSGQMTTARAVSDANGKATVEYDATLWPVPMLLLLEPGGRAWSGLVHAPISGATVSLLELPRSGPLGYWQRLQGEAAFDPTLGKGIKVGVIDTGVGPHPNLNQVKPIGSFIDGRRDTDPTSAIDPDGHGTHVTGIIAALPSEGSGQYAGLAPGAATYVARVFPPGGTANQGDIANAVETLALEYQVDLVNLSLGGSASSIELDAIQWSLEQGTLCICAAGNQDGGSVMYPAAYPQCVAVSAVGVLGALPLGTMAAMNVPTDPAKNTPAGIYVASFSSVGPSITVCAPGVGIVSTVPASTFFDAPYADMSGTSMASPAATATLAARLSRDTAYLALPRDARRAAAARLALANTAIPLGLLSIYQGAGLANLVPQRVL